MKQSRLGSRLTVGVLTGWQVYEGTAIDGYLHPLLEGICAAAREYACNLLLACGVAPPTPPRIMTAAWPIPMPDAQFVPVGPWNTDGLVIVPDILSPERLSQVEDMISNGHPVVFAGDPDLRPAVVVDNARGIDQAVAHLVGHGHRQIAFIAWNTNVPGDAQERLQAYQAALARFGLEVDPRLIAYGTQPDDIASGRQATEHILKTSAPFTALIAFNDWWAIGAMQALGEVGLSTPRDVAVVGFDDRPHARVQSPPLTTILHPTFDLGYQSLAALLNLIDGTWDGRAPIRIPTRLIIRESCGCRAGIALTTEGSGEAKPATTMPRSVVASRVAAAAEAEARHLTGAELVAMSERLIAAALSHAAPATVGELNRVLAEILDETEARGEDTYIWHAAISTLRNELEQWLAGQSEAEQWLDRAHLIIGERSRRQTTQALLREQDCADHLGLMTAHLLAALDEAQISAILAEHLPGVGIQHMLAALYVPEEDDPVASSTLVVHCGLASEPPRGSFITRRLPLSAFYPAGEPVRLALLPLIIQEQVAGLIAFDASNLEPCAVIMRNVAAALRSRQLYHDAAEGRRLAEEANRLKSRFLSTVSHELRTPLNIIVGLSELLVRGEGEGASAYREDLERIYASARHLGFLIRDVLDLASSDAGQLRLVCEPLDLAEVMKLAAGTGEQLARDKGLTWQAQIPEHSPLVWGDRTRLHQVALNFISNAVKFTPHGTVTLTLEALTDRVVVAVSDTGVGIPPADQPIIFDEFRQSERTAARGYGGLGLGLAISKHLVKLHGGEIGVRSSGVEGEGASFYFSLPVMREAEIPAELAALPRQRPVLVLAERKEIAERVESYLCGQGFQVMVHIVAPNQDWRARVKEVTPSALLIERRLLSIEGWGIIRQLQDQPLMQEMPIVFYELHPEGQAGAMLEFDYRLKPLSTEQFARLLAQGGEGHANPQTILVVDDDPDIVHTHTRLIHRQLPDCSVLQAGNGREALSILAHTRPDLILLDLMMPELDGFGVLEAMQEREALRAIPVIVLTGQVLTEADMARLNHGVTAVLEKGVLSMQETLAQVARTLARVDRPEGAARRVVNKAISYLHEHYAEPVTRQQVASAVCVSENYLTNCFHQALGISPMVYLNRYRIKQARSLLEAGDLNITQVAMAVGFADAAYFSRVFQRELGVSPGAFRRGRRPA